MFSLKRPISSWILRIFVVAYGLIASSNATSADTLTIAATGTAMPVLKKLIDDFERQSPGRRVDLLFPPAGSGGAIRGVATKKVDLGVVGRRPRPDLPGADLLVTPWVKTAFVIVTNRTAPRMGYSLEELAAIWSGSVQSWPDGEPIRLVMRRDDDADIAALRAMSPAISRAIDLALKRTGLPSAEHDLQNLEMLGKAPGTIGGSTLGLVLSSQSPLAVINVGGVAPTIRSLKDGSYPYQRPLYLVRHDRLRDHPFITYLHSSRAYKLLESNGFVKSES